LAMPLTLSDVLLMVFLLQRHQYMWVGVTPVKRADLGG
jgi:hypothetical protein